MERFLLDTHIWIWLIQANRDKLKRSALDEAQELHDERRLCVSAISFGRWLILLQRAASPSRHHWMRG